MTSRPKDWYEEGVKAFENGRDLDYCEYDEGSEAYKSWRNGWMDTDEKYSYVEED